MVSLVVSQKTTESEQKETGKKKALSISQLSFEPVSEKELTTAALKALHQGQLPSHLPSTHEKIALLKIMPKKETQKEGVLCALFKEKSRLGYDIYHLYECSQFEQESKARESATIIFKGRSNAIVVIQINNNFLKEYRAGTTLMQVAIETSFARKLNGQVEVSALKESEEFYEKLGFQTAPDGLELLNRSMILYPPEIESWKKRIEAHRILPKQS